MLKHRLLPIILTITLALLTPVFADDKPATTQPADQSAGATTQPSAEDVAKQLKSEIQENPLIEPTQRPASDSARSEHRDSAGVVDPRIIGVAPGTPAPTLRREGEFVVTRRGRLIRSSGSANVLFSFEADAQKSPEPPMVLLPCQMLQNMEDLVQERGDKIIFILSGQVMSYRGANYLLPTMMKLAVDRGNLEQ